MHAMKSLLCCLQMHSFPGHAQHGGIGDKAILWVWAGVSCDVNDLRRAYIS